MLTLNLNAWISSQGGLTSKDLENMCFILRLEVVQIADPDNFKSKCLHYWFYAQEKRTVKSFFNTWGSKSQKRGRKPPL